MLRRTFALAAAIAALVILPSAAQAATPENGHWAGGTTHFRVVENNWGDKHVLFEDANGHQEYARVDSHGQFEICHSYPGTAFDRHRCVRGEFTSPTHATGENSSWMTAPGHHYKFGLSRHEWTAHLQ